MKSYPAYKHSGVPWLGEIPEHWGIQRFANTFRERKTKVSDKEYPPISVTKQGILPQLEKVAKTDNGDNRKLVREGDFVINSRSDRKGSSGISAYTGSVSLINHVLIPMEGWDRSFLHHLLRSVPFQEEFYQKGHGIVADLWTTRYSDISSSYLPVPPLSEQAAIAAYLDKKCGEIDEMVRRRQAIIERLRELKQALIAKAVTKGLHPAVPMKDSGIPWLGKIPEHWTLRPLRTLMRRNEVRGFPKLTLLSVVREKGIIVRNTESKEENHNFIPDDLSKYKLVRKGQFVINKMKAWQGSYGISDYEGIVSPAYFVYSMDNSSLLPAFFHTAIRSMAYIPFFSRYSDGVRIGQWDLDEAEMKKITFYCPPLPEQSAIVAYLDKKCAAIDELISRHGQIVEKLRELKASTIAHVVTGKVDIREGA